MKIFWAIMMVICIVGALLNAWLDNASMTMILCTTYLMCYDQMWRGPDEKW